MKTLTIVSMLLTLTACLGPNLKPHQQVDLSPYIHQVKEACLKSHAYSTMSKKDRITLCTSNGERTLDASESYLGLSDMEKICENTDEKKYTDCVLTFQQQYHSKSVKAVIDKNYK